jgi:riboflavin kinase/FMN adenylyltransferase
MASGYVSIMTKMIDIQSLQWLPSAGNIAGVGAQASLFRSADSEGFFGLTRPVRSPLQVISDAASVPPALKDGVLLLGNFDGFHRGHQALLADARARACPQNRSIGIMSVEPHPRQLFAPQAQAFRLSTPAIKRKLFSAHGLDFLYSPSFDRDFAAQEPEQFVDRILMEGFEATHLVVGSSFRFGRQRRGDVEMLYKLGEQCGFGVSVVDEVQWSGATCSSQAIRKLLGEGEVEAANAMLGHRWSVDLRLPQPTVRVGGWALIDWPCDVLLPASGEYAVAFKGRRESQATKNGSVAILPSGEVWLSSDGPRDLDAVAHLSLRVEFLANLTGSGKSIQRRSQ